MSKILKCPHCEEEITRLAYNCYTNGREWGTAEIYLNGDDIETGCHDCDETETTDWQEYFYECPECNEELDISEIEIVEDDEEETTETNEDGQEVKEEKPKITEIICNRTPQYSKSMFDFCPKCGTAYEKEETIQECIKCGNLLT